MITYILLGIAFMFCIEYLLSMDSIKERMTTTSDIADMIWTKRIIGVLFWPVWLGIFIYNFLTSYFE